MIGHTTSTWGYKLLSDTLINFYHILLPKISTNSIRQYIPQIESISKQKDGSITLSVRSPLYSSLVLEKIISFFHYKEKDFIETPRYYYKVESHIRQTLKPWALSFEGCLALLISSDPQIKPLIDPQWQLLDSRAGGLYVPPYTLLLYASYPKILHPITIHNALKRRIIEQVTSKYVRRVIKLVSESQPGLEGLAMISLVASKTKLSSQEISEIVHEKSLHVKNPIFSPFFVRV